MLISPHIVGHYSREDLLLTLKMPDFGSPHIGSITYKSFEDLLLEVLSSHKKEVVLCEALKED